MQTVADSVAWAGPNIDAFTLFVEPTPATWVAESVVAGETPVYLYQTLNNDRQRTGQLAGVHIVGFLNFSRWSDLPELDILWQVPGKEPVSLEELLRAEEAQAQKEAKQHATVRTGSGCV